LASLLLLTCEPDALKTRRYESSDEPVVRSTSIVTFWPAATVILYRSTSVAELIESVTLPLRDNERASVSWSSASPAVAVPGPSIAMP
jgi:hypothetical protein